MSDRREYLIQYRLANRERIKAYNTEYNARTLERRAAWARANPDRIKEANRRWANANPNKVVDRNENYRARKRGAYIESVDRTFVFERDDGVCQICHEPIGESAWHIDHVMPLVAGGLHCYANVQLSHARCNRKKGARIPVVELSLVPSHGMDPGS